MEARRLRAPSADGGILADPPLHRFGEALSAGRAWASAWSYDFQGRTTARLRPMAVGQALDASRRHHTRFGLDVPHRQDAASLVVTGHQPELFHPGVWVKNFAVAALAESSGATALNLIVDNDIAKDAIIRVPFVEGDSLRVLPVEFDLPGVETPFEDLAIRDPTLFDSFPDRVRAVYRGIVADPVLNEFEPALREVTSIDARTGFRFAAARRRIEASWGVRNAEVPLSAVCESEAFCWFASHLLAHLPRFRTVHNSALAAYRRTYGIRSKNHPVPELRDEGDWLEAPFWVWRARAPRRKPLMARQATPAVMHLRIAGESEPFLELPLGPERDACCTVERLAELASMGIRLRTRALTTTMYARLVLGDVFLHGIGGAKYDELGDEIVRRFFGIEPPRYLTLSMTARLPLPTVAASQAELRTSIREARDIAWNPDRHLADPTPEQRAWMARKSDAIGAPIATHRQRVDRWHALRQVVEALRPAVAEQLGEAEARTERLRVGLRHNRLAASREFAFPLHSAATLRVRFDRVRDEVRRS